MTHRLTRKQYRIILEALNMVAAGDWDESSYGERPDFEALIAKIKMIIHDWYKK